MRRYFSLLGVGVFAIASLLLAVDNASAQLFNGDFSQGVDGLDGWTMWTQRDDGNIDFTVEVVGGVAQMRGDSFNGGLYQVVNVPTNAPIQVFGNWASNPTVTNDQWAEVILVDGDISDSLNGGADITGPLLYKSDTFEGRGAWDGTFATASNALNNPMIEPALSGSQIGMVTLVLKSGSGGPGSLNGTDYSNIALTVPEPSTWLLIGLGSIGLLPLIRRRLRRRSA